MKQKWALLGSNLPRDSQGERGEAGIAKRPQMFTERPGGVSRITARPPRRFFLAGFASFFGGFHST
jgi:hypothetical protein